MPLSIVSAAAPVDATVGSAVEAATAPPPAWTWLERMGFRIAFLWLVCFLFFFGNGTMFNIVPLLGNWSYNGLMWAPLHVTEWVGQHVFHLTGVGAHWHPTGSGDTALNWIMNGLYVVGALVGGLAWTAIAELRGGRKEYTTLNAWLRFLLRLTCGMFMLTYGFAKVYPLQMAPISIGILNEPVGNMSPMTMLWAAIGLHPWYEVVCGLAEVAGGLLILFRRTALLGALVSAFVMTNVLLYNLFFDVPVKLFAAGLLVACLFLTLPDARALWNFFWRHEATAPSATWMPPAQRRWWRITLRVVEIVFTFGFILYFSIGTGMGWRDTLRNLHTPSPLLGSWHVEGAPAKGAFLTGEGAPTSDLYIDTVQRAFRRSTNGDLWRTGIQIDASKHRMSVYGIGSDGTQYSWQMPDADHLILTSVAPDAPKGNGKTPPKPVPPFTPETISFTREPIMAHPFLLERGFHFVNEWGLER